MRANPSLAKDLQVGQFGWGGAERLVNTIAQLDAIRSIALHVRSQFIADGCDVDGRCVELAEALCSELVRRGYDPKTVRGKFRMDRPYTKWGPQPDPCTAIHEWVEIDGLIVDVTAAQFNDYLNEAASQILIGTYKELRRYEKT